MMTWIVIALAALLLLAVVGAVFQLLWRLLRPALRILGLAGLGLLMIGGFGAGVIAIQEGAWLPAASSALASWVAYRLLRRLLATPAQARSEAADHDLVRLPTNVEEEALWKEFAGRLRWHQRHRVASIRSSIQAFNLERESPSFSAEHHSLAVTLDRRVPELLTECLRRCGDATARERRLYCEKVLETLEKVAAKADAERTELREADDRELEVLHHYFAQVTEQPTLS